MRGNRTTLFLAAIGVLGVILAFVFFTYDDPPGLLLLGAASIALVLAFTHTWRETKKFVTLLFGGMVSLGFLAHVFDALAEVSAHVVPVSRALGFLAVMSFFVAVFLGWAGILVGAVGALLLRVLEKTRSRA
jgi:hypothetical protein